MFCSNCGKEIPEGAKFCGYCGAAQAQKAAEEVVKEAAEVEKAAEAAVEEVKETVAEAPKPAYSPIPEEPQKGKKGKGGKVAAIMIACAAVLVLAVGGILFFARDKVSNAVHKTFDKPKDYYSYVEKKGFEALTNKAGSESMTKLLESMKSGDRSMTETVKIKLGTRGKDYVALASTVGVDLSWLESVGITYHVGMKEDMMKLVMAPLLNDVKLGSADILFDLKGGNAFFGVPELSEKYLGISFGEDFDYSELSEKMEEMYGAYDELLEAYPEPEKVAELIVKYYDIAMAQIETMEKTKEKLEAEDVAQECTKLTMELNSKDFQKVLRAIVKELYKDKDVEKMIEKFGDAMTKYDEEIDGEKFYEQFTKSLDEFDEKIEEIEIDKLTMEVYVDGSGNIVGRTIVIKVKGESVRVVFSMPHKDDKIGFELSVKTPDEDESFSLTGSGKEKAGKFEGEFKLKVGTQRVLSVSIEEYDLKAAMDGGFSGSITFKPGSDINISELIRNEFRGDESNPVYSLIANLDPSLRISGQMTLESHDLSFTVLDAGSEIFSLCMSGNMNDSEDYSVPSSYIKISDGDYDEDELIAYVKGLKFDVIIDNLKKADVPQEYIDMIQTYIDRMMGELDRVY